MNINLFNNLHQPIKKDYKIFLKDLFVPMMKQMQYNKEKLKLIHCSEFAATAEAEHQSSQGHLPQQNSKFNK